MLFLVVPVEQPVQIRSLVVLELVDAFCRAAKDCDRFLEGVEVIIEVVDHPIDLRLHQLGHRFEPLFVLSVEVGEILPPEDLVGIDADLARELRSVYPASSLSVDLIPLRHTRCTERNLVRIKIVCIRGIFTDY